MTQQQLFVPTFRIDECLAEIRECLEKGWTGLGFKTVEFEERAYTGLPNAHFLNSATAGLKFAVRLLKHKHGWEDGDEIISTPITFVSTNHPALQEAQGEEPVLAFPVRWNGQCRAVKDLARQRHIARDCRAWPGAWPDRR